MRREHGELEVVVDLLARLDTRIRARGAVAGAGAGRRAVAQDDRRRRAACPAGPRSRRSGRRVRIGSPTRRRRRGDLDLLAEQLEAGGRRSQRTGRRSRRRRGSASSAPSLPAPSRVAPFPIGSVRDAWLCASTVPLVVWVGALGVDGPGAAAGVGSTWSSESIARAADGVVAVGEPGDLVRRAALRERLAVEAALEVVDASSEVNVNADVALVARAGRAQGDRRLRRLVGRELRVDRPLSFCSDDDRVGRRGCHRASYGPVSRNRRSGPCTRQPPGRRTESRAGRRRDLDPPQPGRAVQLDADIRRRISVGIGDGPGDRRRLGQRRIDPRSAARGVDVHQVRRGGRRLVVPEFLQEIPGAGAVAERRPCSRRPEGRRLCRSRSHRCWPAIRCPTPATTQMSSIGSPAESRTVPEIVAPGVEHRVHACAHLSDLTLSRVRRLEGRLVVPPLAHPVARAALNSTRYDLGIRCSTV